MDVLWNELMQGLPDGEQVARIAVRMLMAILLAGVIGYERERTGKSAGLRTHMLVALGAATFVLTALESGMQIADLSRVIQGVAAGIGFIGGGTILKMAAEREIHGLTTAASLWMTAAIGLTVGVGKFGVAVMTVALAWLILSVLGRIEPHLSDSETHHIERDT